MTTTWVVKLETDPETGDLVMPLPTEILESQGWQIGDVLTWDVDPESQEVTLRKKTNE
jgi:bifunctional DNA-binding transcriptional regulator/antitoxin component of YhaV-PrlF toxin-antitoxin module